MRARPPLLGLVLFGAGLLVGCAREPDFDEQYDKTASEIEMRAKKIDADMARQMKAMDNELAVKGMATTAASPQTGTSGR